MWHAARCVETLTGETVEQAVEKWMSTENIKVEVKENGVWVDSTGDL